MLSCPKLALTTSALPRFGRIAFSSASIARKSSAWDGAPPCSPPVPDEMYVAAGAMPGRRRLSLAMIDITAVGWPSRTKRPGTVE